MNPTANIGRLGAGTALALAVLACVSARAAEERVLCDFEAPDGMKLIEGRDKIQLVAEHATQGKQAGKIPGGFTLTAGTWTGLPADWSGFDQFRLDVFNPGEPVKVSAWITDKEGNDYWKRHNAQFNLRAGANTLVIAVGGLYRGEKGSGKFLDPKGIQQLLLSFPKSDGGFFIDNIVLAKGAAGGKAEIKVLAGFEADKEAGLKWAIEDWPEDKPGKSESSFVAEHVTEGKRALKVVFRANGGGIHVTDLADGDWSKYDSLELDCFNTSEQPLKISGWFRDAEAAPSDGDYWKRHNYQTNLKPGASTIRFPMGGFYRGEKGSGKFLDTKKMLSFCISCSNVTLYLDNLRLVKGGEEVAVEGLKAFDFGSKNSPTYPGFTAVSNDTDYNKAQGYGCAGQRPTDARDYEHPDPLFSDFVRLSGNETFAVDVPNGEYTVYAVIDSIGYWDYMHWSHRSIEANGVEVINEKVSAEQFLKEFYFRHQDDEDLPGTDIWQKYIQRRFQPKIFSAKVENGQLKLAFKGDTWGLTLCALVVYPVTQKDAGARWLEQLDRRRREDFYTAFAETVRKAEPKPELSAAEQSAGYALFRRDLEQDIYFNSAPGGDPKDAKDVKIDWAACPGEYAAADFCVYPLKDCGTLTVMAGDLSGPNGAKISGEAVRIRAIRYKFKRIGGRITSAFEYRPELLVDFKEWPVPANVTRRFWVTAKVPADAAPGAYTGKLTLNLAGGTREIPIALQVYPIKLDEPEMSFGMYGGSGPTAGWWPQDVKALFRIDERIEEVIRDQREHGMTALTPPAPSFKGFKDGKAEFDYSNIDRAMELLHKYGYQRTCFTYASMFRVHEGDLEAECKKQYGLPLEQAIKLAYEELGRHAKEKSWLPMAWALADEPLIHGISAETVIKVFEAHRKAAPQMQFVSEDAMGDPAHYVVIPAIDIVSGNSPRYKVAEAVKKNKSRYWYNNIGCDRLTFGWFLWKSRKELGVEALFQWGYSTNAADIYYDLDGSEGDSGVSFTASEGQRARRPWETIR
ncbi:MAG: hypothetical protein HY291_13010 [Planctomycetes bacterium]|nr:hypothetical protein [Planctomycetota bacterium]